MYFIYLYKGKGLKKSLWSRNGFGFGFGFGKRENGGRAKGVKKVGIIVRLVSSRLT